MEKLVSVIVPVYNVAPYLERCLNSILQQTYENIELIIVNDGSTDTSGEICSNYKNKYANVTYFCQSNQGVSEARNKGVALSRGDYILFVDADDYLDRSAVEKCMRLVKKTHCEMVAFLRTSSKVDSDSLSKVVTMTGREACEEALYDNRGGIVAICTERNIVEQTPLQGLSYSEDTAICYQRFFLASKVCFLDEYLYYVQGDNTKSLTRSIPDYHKRFDTLQAYLQRQVFIESYFSNSPVVYYNVKQLLRSALSLLTTLYYRYTDREIRKMDEYQSLRNVIYVHRNNKEAVRMLGIKYQLLLHCFERSDIHKYVSKLSCMAKVYKEKFNQARVSRKM